MLPSVGQVICVWGSECDRTEVQGLASTVCVCVCLFIDSVHTQIERHTHIGVCVYVCVALATGQVMAFRFEDGDDFGCT